MARLVIVDDQTPLAAVLAQFFSQRGFSVQTAGLEAALSLVRAHQPDVLLLDPYPGSSGLDGAELLRTLKALCPKAVIFIISAEIRDEKKATMLELGAKRYFEKPLSMREVLQAIHDNLSAEA